MLQAVNQRKVILKYHDLYGNQYMQYIWMYQDGGEMVTTAGQSELAMCTKRTRYVQ